METFDTQDVEFLDDLASFLISPDVEQLLAVHPNRAALPDFSVPPSWTSWWEWASNISGNAGRKWQQLWRYYVTPQTDLDPSVSIPQELRSLIDKCRNLQLNRDPNTVACVPSRSSKPCPDLPLPDPSPSLASSGAKTLRGMSPKKAHEVCCMTNYTSQLLAYLSRQGVPIKHVVDVGAGQVRIISSSRFQIGSVGCKPECAISYHVHELCEGLWFFMKLMRIIRIPIFMPTCCCTLSW